MFLGWFDDSKKPVAQKIADACAAYTVRYQKVPTVVLCNERDVADVAGLVVRAETYVRPNNFWIGMVESGA